MFSKGEILDLFYKIQPVTRSGGGTLNNKMTRCTVTSDEQKKMKEKIYDSKLMTYYNKLLTKDVTIAPPPRTY